MWLRRQMGRRWGWVGGAVKWHSWQMTSPVSQSPLLSTMICHLHFWHFSSHYQITLTEWYFLILPALEHTKNNGLHMLCALVLFPCPSLHFRSRVSRKYPVISSFFFLVMNMWQSKKHCWRDLPGSNERLSANLNSLVYEEHNLFSLSTHHIGERGESRLLRQWWLRLLRKSLHSPDVHDSVYVTAIKPLFGAYWINLIVKYHNLFLLGPVTLGNKVCAMVMLFFFLHYTSVYISKFTIPVCR